MKTKNIYIIAGSNGSGKTTFARLFLPDYVHCPHFVNADLIAQGLSPFEPRSAALKAGKLVLGQIRDYSSRGLDFAFESTLAGKSYASLLRRLKTSGYAIHVFFLWIPSPALAVDRIKDRVAEGGHFVPTEDVHRRFFRGLRNFFKLYRPLTSSWMLFDNSGMKPTLIAKGRNGNEDVLIKDLYEKIWNESRKR